MREKRKIDHENVFGKQLKYLRLKQDKTQEEFAASIGMSYENLSKLENGKRNPSFETLVILRKKFKFDINSMMDEINMDQDEENED